MSNNPPPGFDDGEIPGFGTDDDMMMSSSTTTITETTKYLNSNNNNNINNAPSNNLHQQPQQHHHQYQQQHHQQPQQQQQQELSLQEQQMLMLFSDNNNNNNMNNMNMNNMMRYNNNNHNTMMMGNNHVGRGGFNNSIQYIPPQQQQQQQPSSSSTTTSTATATAGAPPPVMNDFNDPPPDQMQFYYGGRGGGAGGGRGRGGVGAGFGGPRPPPPPHEVTNTILIKYLDPEYCKEDFIKQVAQPYGEVLKVDMKRDNTMVFIHFRKNEEAQNMLETLYLDLKNCPLGNCKLGYGKQFEYDEEGNIIGDMEFLNRSKEENEKRIQQEKQQRFQNNIRRQENQYPLISISEEEANANPQEYFDNHGNRFKHRCGRYKLKNDPSPIVFCGNLPDDMPDSELDSFFKERFEGYESYSRNHHSKTGLLFAHFDKVENASKCIEVLLNNHAYILGRKVNVDYGRPKDSKFNNNDFGNNNNNDENKESGRIRPRRGDYNQNNDADGNAQNFYDNETDFYSGGNNNRSFQTSSNNEVMLGGALVTLPMESDVTNEMLSSNNNNAKAGPRSAAEILASLKPKYFTKDRSKTATTLSNVFDNSNNNKQQNKENAVVEEKKQSETEAELARQSAAVDTKIFGLQTFSYFSCGLFPPHTTPNAVAALIQAIDDDNFGDGDDNFVDASSNKVILELENIITPPDADGGNNDGAASSAQTPLPPMTSPSSGGGVECLPHAIAVVTKRLREYYNDDPAKRLHIYYLVSTFLFKNAAVQSSIITRALEQFAWLTAVVAEGNDSTAAFEHIKLICSNMKTVVQNVLGNSSTSNEALDLLDAVVKTKIESKQQASDLMAELDALI